MAVFSCKMCGAPLEINEGDTVAVCEYCGTRQTLPRLDNDKKANLYDRANHFRRNNEYDKAAGIYEQILNEDRTDAEAYWSLVLCRYGIEYVEDPAAHERIPTVNRAQFTSVLADEDYKSALKYADSSQREIYEREAKAIDEIQKGILAISQKEEPFDVFICYKETDNDGRRTRDSVLANDLYYQLTQEGFKVFFSRITLEDKLGTAYEPYIFAALNSAKVMVVVGTKAEYFNAVWVKNEWSRYLALIKNGAKKTLIPAYRDMDPYDLPEEFSHLQAQDMGKLGFMQDLIRGIKKIVNAETPRETVRENNTQAPNGSSQTESLLKRAFMFLEDGNWQEADTYCERILDMDPENARAYLGKLMAELHICRQEELKDCKEPFDGNGSYQKAVRFADKDLAEQLQADIAFICERNEKARFEAEQARLGELYQQAQELMLNAEHLASLQSVEAEAEYNKAAEAFGKATGFQDADEKQEECLKQAEVCRNVQLEQLYQKALYTMQEADTEALYNNAAYAFGKIQGFRDADEMRQKCLKRADECYKDDIYIQASNVLEHSKFMSDVKQALSLFQSISGWKDADDKITACQQKIEKLKIEKEERERQNAAEAVKHQKRTKKILIVVFAVIAAVAVLAIIFNTVFLPNYRYQKAEELDQTGNYISAALSFAKLGNHKDAAARSMAIWKEQINRNITVSAGYVHTVGLHSDGTVVAVGPKEDNHLNDGQFDVSDWTNIVAVAAGGSHTVGLRSDGTVVAVGDNGNSQCNVSGWSNIIAVAAGGSHTIGLCSDGTVVAVGNHYYGQCDVNDWINIVAVAAGDYYTVGLCSDGSVVAVGCNDEGNSSIPVDYGQCDVSDWENIIAVVAGGFHTVGLRTDGTVMAVGFNGYGQCEVSDWENIIAVAAGGYHTIGLRSDGTVVAVGDNDDGQCEVSGWSNIVAVAAGSDHTIGLRSDGTVVAVGDNFWGQCDVSRWKNIRLPD